MGKPPPRRWASMRWCRLCALVVAAAAEGPGAEEEATCPAGQRCAAQGAAGGVAHHWPSTRGRDGRLSHSPHVGPRNLSAALAWTWNHPGGKYHTVINGGPLIDQDRNIYLTSLDGIRKFDLDGKTLWTFHVESGAMCGMPVLMGAALYASATTGIIFSLSLETGQYIWSVTMPRSIGMDIHSLGIQDNVLLAATGGTLNMQPPTGNDMVSALNATDGSLLWEFRPDVATWNFLPVFTEDGTFVFQDQIGGVYRVRVDSGELLWRAGYIGHLGETWMDGGVMLGDGIVYAVRTSVPLSMLGPFRPGDLSAYGLSDGRLLWRQEVPHPPHSWPVVGRLHNSSRPLVLLPIGSQCGTPGVMSLPPALPTWLKVAVHLFSLWLGDWSRFLWRNPEYPTEVRAFDAETGAFAWSWAPPAWRRLAFPGDEEGLLERLEAGTQPFCIPNPWGSPTLDAAGTVYLSNMNGHVYAIRDENGDGAIDHATEVDSFHAGSAFSHPGPSLAPGVLAVASCDTLYVFKHE
mmetsp:Transcript_101778/g.308839  ORF Transcript_101778/g.308839 Transcript_101778/m.308839 type:complete len:518 (+) Transcript_101778:32-1585(+)